MLRRVSWSNALAISFLAVVASLLVLTLSEIARAGEFPAATAKTAEEIAMPSFRRGGFRQEGADGYGQHADDHLQFKVAPTGVHSISVQVTTYAKNGRKDVQVFEMNPADDRGAFPDASGFRVWESPKIFAAREQWRTARNLVDRVEFSYTVRKEGADGRALVESDKVYEFAGSHEAAGNFSSNQFYVAGKNPGRNLDHVNLDAVPGAVARLAKTPPKAEYEVLPGNGPENPLHPKHTLMAEIDKVIDALKANPGRRFMLKVAVFNSDDRDLTAKLAEAKKLGAQVEKITDWYQTTPYLSEKASIEQLRDAQVPVYGMVRNSRYKDIASMHMKTWLIAELDHKGAIVNGTVADCTFNTEFGNYPNNQEDMLVFRNNRDVALVYNHFLEAMKGNVPLKLTIDPNDVKFLVTHPLYPYELKSGEKFGSLDMMRHLVKGAKRQITTMDLVMQEPVLADDMIAKLKENVRVDNFMNGWKVKNGAGAEASKLAAAGANEHLVFFKDNDSSPVHHKTWVIDSKWVKGGSANPGPWTWRADETAVFIQDEHVAEQVEGQANRLAHDYRNENWGKSYEVRKVETEFRTKLPAGVKEHSLRELVLYNSAEHPVKLERDAKTGEYFGKATMPEGVVRGGWLTAHMEDGSKVEGPIRPFVVRAKGVHEIRK